MSENLIAYVVTAGEYSDYRIKGVFFDEDSARRYADSLSDSDVEVEAYPARGPEFVAGRDIHIGTRVDAKTGEILREYSSANARDAKEQDGQCATHIYSSSRNYGEVLEYTVSTTADVTQEERARKSHSERVAKLRAEVMGL
ncbi:hypothetical protein [Streptomyces sp. SID2119]|uniref:DUF7336 domain-containing protein n=1 Tax=Streptomyces sp. SID2119 TaxID=2690253 RepID=UPI0013712311|nr:hypothetical protein [Streptomyces sp. SID2119]MYW28217.1 hypothetical protein [Streptomyces sp. SID2119]